MDWRECEEPRVVFHLLSLAGLDYRVAWEGVGFLERRWAGLDWRRLEKPLVVFHLERLLELDAAVARGGLRLMERRWVRRPELCEGDWHAA